MERIFRVRDLSKIHGMFRMAFNAAGLFTEPFEIVLRPLKAKRSADQNRRYWALLREVAATVWVDGRQYSDETWHRYFAGAFIGHSEVPMPDGTVAMHPISTTTLNVADMGRYMDEITRWCAEQGFPVMEAA
ncbi:MAG TPA: recombination protein NinB [Lysobacter sp.]|nr:recombination protein NinB [Lysobacter sp.]